METPFVSIILSTYNRSEYIKESIESVLNQSFKAFEFIIINDCSNDNNIEKIILNYWKKDNRIIYIKNKKNLWISKSRNKWLKIAKWEYIAIIDDDDIWEKDKLEKQIRFMENNKDYILCWTNTIIIDENNNEIWKIKYWINNKDIKNNLLKINQFVNSSIIFQNKWLLYNEKSNLAEDYELTLKLWFLWKFKNINEYLTKYRVHRNSTTRKKNIEMELQALKLMLKYRNNYWWFYKWILIKIKSILINSLINMTNKIWIYSILSPLWRKYILRRK